MESQPWISTRVKDRMKNLACSSFVLVACGAICSRLSHSPALFTYSVKILRRLTIILYQERKKTNRPPLDTLKMEVKRAQRMSQSPRSSWGLKAGVLLLSNVLLAFAAADPSARFLGATSNNFIASGRARRSAPLGSSILTGLNKKYSKRLCLSTRGGSQDPSSGNIPPPPQYQSPGYQNQPPQQQQQQRAPPPPQPQYQQQQYEQDPDQPPPLQEETFQEKIDSWRTYQMEHAAEQRSSQDPRDTLGRMKLLTSVSKGSRAVTFFILMWRDIHLYEVVDQKFKGTLRFMGVLPLTILFIANMAGVVASVTSSGHSAKKRLKAILNLDKLMEVFLILSYICKLIFSTSKLVPREIYISCILHSVFFLIQCQTVTRFVWYVLQVKQHLKSNCIIDSFAGLLPLKNSGKCAVTLVSAFS